MEAKGLTTEQLQQKIHDYLADGYILNPQVKVTIEEYNSKKVYVLGEFIDKGVILFTVPPLFLN